MTNVLVLFPFLELSQELYAKLESQKIYCFNFTEVFNVDSLEIDFSILSQNSKTNCVRENNSEYSAGSKYDIEFKNNDKIEVYIGGTEINIKDSDLILLMYFVIKLKDKNLDDFVSLEDVVKEEIATTQNHFQRLVKNLRDQIDPALGRNKQNFFIETIKGQGKYKINLKAGKIKIPNIQYLQSFKKNDEAIEQNWSTRALGRQINSFYYERILSSKDRKAVADEAEQKTKSLGEIVADLVKVYFSYKIS